METVTTIAAVRARLRQWRASGERIAFVPTMGNLHPGHISLIEAARRSAARFVASIFVNPMQFGANEDFAHYPRTVTKDSAMLSEAGCDLMFMPDAQEIYPRGLQGATRVEVPQLSRMLCGEFRPGHFEGVTTVVATLFNIVEPDIAVFGEKDYQQLTIIRRMVADLLFDIEIVAAPTVREADGLAMSSRNQYLTAAERKIAPKLYGALQCAVKRLAAVQEDYAAIEAAGRAELLAAGFEPEYFAVREASDLHTPRRGCAELVVLTAARLGRARLIDNLKVS
jgi:pantoate--beta-alanine ligase